MKEKQKFISVRQRGMLLFCLLFFCYSFVHQRSGWNQDSRLDLLHALFAHKTFKIDAYHNNTGDKAIEGGHFYSDKPPGVVLLAIPAFAASKAILEFLHIPLDSSEGWLASSWLTTAGSVGLITALGGVAMFAFLNHLVGQRIGFLTTIAVFLGSAPFPYATMLFSHAAVIGLICIALWAIADEKFFLRMTAKAGVTCFAVPDLHADRPWVQRHLLAGLCCGLAVSSEYTAAIAAGGVIALALATNFKRGVILSFAVIPPLLLIPTYNWICFGGPLAFGYHHLALPEFQAMNKGLFGITFPPRPSSIYLLLFSLERGLFFWTPFFLMAVLGLKPAFGSFPRFSWISCIVILLQVICISGYYMPNGGAALGPRHLAPIIPFVTILAALAFRRHPKIGSILGYLSLLITGVATLIEALPPSYVPNPLWHIHLPMLANAEFTHHLGQYTGLIGKVLLASLALALIVPHFFFGSDGLDREARASSQRKSAGGGSNC